MFGKEIIASMTINGFEKTKEIYGSDKPMAICELITGIVVTFAIVIPFIIAAKLIF